MTIAIGAVLARLDSSAIARDFALATLTLLALPTLLWLAMGALVFVDRPLVNVDYLLFGAVALWLPRPLVVLVLSALLALDIVFALAPAYHFRPESVAGSIAELFTLDPLFTLSRAGLLLALVVIAVVSISWILGRARQRWSFSGSCLVLLVSAVVIDAWASPGAARVPIATVNLAFSSANNLRVALATAGQATAAEVAGPAARASGRLLNDLEAGKLERRVVLVVVESLGRFVDPDVQALQLEPLTDLAGDGRHEVTTGVVAFQGSTVPGELRELCGLRLLSVHPPISAVAEADCLPERLRAARYPSLAVHGFFGSVFSRHQWYPAVGFERRWFASDVGGRIASQQRCGIAFNGWCDRDVWRAILDELHRDVGQRQFVYWLTLTAHLPVTAASEEETGRLCQAPGLRGSAGACALLATHRRLFAEIAASLREVSAAGIRVLLVGDHMPPFLDTDSRALFDPLQVPFIDLRPIAAEQASALADPVAEP